MCDFKVGDKVVIHLKKDVKRVYESNLSEDDAAKVILRNGLLKCTAA